MSLQSEPKLAWPETKLHFPVPAQVIPETKLVDLWTSFVPAFQGKYSRFTSYLMYLSTDFSGGFKVCSVLGTNPAENTFNVPFNPPGPPVLIDIRNQIWAKSQKKDWEELNREDWELLGFSFLLTGEINEFHKWVKMTDREFGLTDECKKFLFVLGWNSDAGNTNSGILQALVDYSKGEYDHADFEMLANSVLKDGHWQLSGVLVDSISKNAWSGKQTLYFLDFLSGFYSDWQDWEKEKFLNLSLGKVPPFIALKRAKKILNSRDFNGYLNHLKIVFRGSWEEPETEFGYDLRVPYDPFILTLLRYEREGETYFREVLENLKSTPYSYFVNIQLAILYYRTGDYTRFLESYEKGGRLRYLSVPLYFFAKVKESRKEETRADSIFQS